jgi:hypothetical protein
LPGVTCYEAVLEKENLPKQPFPAILCGYSIVFEQFPCYSHLVPIVLLSENLSRLTDNIRVSHHQPSPLPINQYSGVYIGFTADPLRVVERRKIDEQVTGRTNNK